MMQQPFRVGLDAQRDIQVHRGFVWRQWTVEEG